MEPTPDAVASTDIHNSGLWLWQGEPTKHDVAPSMNAEGPTMSHRRSKWTRPLLFSVSVVGFVMLAGGAFFTPPDATSEPTLTAKAAPPPAEVKAPEPQKAGDQIDPAILHDVKTLADIMRWYHDPTAPKTIIKPSPHRNAKADMAAQPKRHNQKRREPSVTDETAALNPFGCPPSICFPGDDKKAQ